MAELRDQLQATLGDSLILEHELGGGGMSRVFVAHEAGAMPESQDALFALTLDQAVVGVYSVLGDADSAIPAIEKVLQRTGELPVNALRLDPMFAPIRNDPRFQRLLSGS